MDPLKDWAITHKQIGENVFFMLYNSDKEYVPQVKTASDPDLGSYR